MAEVPYANASSGAAAREEATRLLRRLGASSVGWMDDYDKAEVLLAFTHRGRPVQFRASAKGWAAMFLRAEPWTSRRKSTKASYEASALRQGHIAISSVIRDWVKGQMTAIECGAMSFEGAFLAHILLPDGRTVMEHAAERNLLPASEDKP